MDFVNAQSLNIKLNRLILSPSVFLFLFFQGGIRLVKIFVLRCAHHETQQIELLLVEGLDPLHELQPKVSISLSARDSSLLLYLCHCRHLVLLHLLCIQLLLQLLLIKELLIQDIVVILLLLIHHNFHLFADHFFLLNFLFGLTVLLMASLDIVVELLELPV